MAINRLQAQIQNQNQHLGQITNAPDSTDDATFLTEANVKQINIDLKAGQSDQKDPYGISTMLQSKGEETAAQTSYIGAQNSYLTNGTGNVGFVNSIISA